MSGPTATALLLLAITLSVVGVTLAQQIYPYAQYVAPYTGMYGLSGHYGQYGYGTPSYTYPYYGGGQQQTSSTYTGMGSSDMRHSGDDLNGFWLMCTSKNCGRGRK